MERADPTLGLESRQRAAAAGGCVAVYLRLHGRMRRSSGGSATGARRRPGVTWRATGRQRETLMCSRCSLKSSHLVTVEPGCGEYMGLTMLDVS